SNLRVGGGFGSGITGDDTLTISNSTISDNSGGGVANGGGGTMTISSCTITGNHDNGSGGGIFNLNCPATTTNSTTSGTSAQFGGGIYNHLYALTLSNCPLTGNLATVEGGAIENGGDDVDDFSPENPPPPGTPLGSVTLIHCTLAGNTAH